MAFDLIFRNVTLPDGRKGHDSQSVRRPHRGDRAGRSWPKREQTIDAHGYLLAPPFVDCHFHIDATLSLGLPRLNVSGTLLEGIALWGELKPHLTHEAVAERALRYCDLAVSQGLLAVRSHVDVCDDRLIAVEALIDVKEQGEALSRSATRRISRRTAISAPRTRRAISSARSTSASTSSAASRISSARWRRARLP